MKSNRKIGYLIPEFPGQTHIFFWREIVALREMGASVRLISTKRGNAEKVKHDFVAGAVAETYYLFPLPVSDALWGVMLRPLWLLRAILYCLCLREGGWYQRLRVAALIPFAGALLKLCKREAIAHVHVHSCANSAHVVALAALNDEISYSLTLHGDLSVYGNNHQQKMRGARFIASVTEPLRQQLIHSAGVKPDLAPVIWMGVDIEKFRPAPARAGSGSLRLITVARLAQCKGHTYTLQALERFHKAGYNFHYTIVGGGEKESALKAECLARGLEHVVEFTGTLSENEILARLGSADALLLTSVGYGEAAPVCVMEAMACGIPVLVSRIGGTPDMVDHGRNGFLLSQGSVDEIYAALVTLAENPEVRLQLGAEARRHAVQYFSVRTQADRLLKLILAEST